MTTLKELPFYDQCQVAEAVATLVSERHFYDWVCHHKGSIILIDELRQEIRRHWINDYDKRLESYVAYSVVEHYWEEHHKKFSSGAQRGADKYLGVLLVRPTQHADQAPWSEGNPCNEVKLPKGHHPCQLGIDALNEADAMAQNMKETIDNDIINKLKGETNMQAFNKVTYIFGKDAADMSFEDFTDALIKLEKENTHLNSIENTTKAIEKAIAKNEKQIKLVMKEMDKYHG